MAFQAIASTAGLVANWPTTTTGSDLWAYVSVDAATTIGAATGWTLQGSLQLLTLDGQVAGLYRYTGNGGAGAPSSPPATSTWTSTSADAIVQIVSLTGRSLGATAFTTVTNADTSHAYGSTFTFPGGTMTAGCDLIVFQAYDNTGAASSGSSVAATGSPGTFTDRGWIVSGSGGWATGSTSTLNNTAAGATGTLSQVSQVSNPNNPAYAVVTWVIAVKVASAAPATNAIFFGAGTTS